MSDPKKIVIKINRPATRVKMQSHSSHSDRITEWNIPRIVFALSILLILVFLIYFVFHDKDRSSKTTSETSKSTIDESVSEVKSQLVKNSAVHEIVASNLSKPNTESVPIDKKASSEPVISDASTATVGAAVEQAEKEPGEAGTDSVSGDGVKEEGGRADTDKNVSVRASDKLPKISHAPRVVIGNKENVIKPKGRFFSTHVARAVLALSVSEKEPVGVVESPLRIKNDKATGVFYFTEIKGMKGRKFRHEWWHEGRLVYKKAVDVRGKRWRASTSKMINRFGIGAWSVKLVGENGKIYHQIEFRAVADKR
ncbi:MAG: DUF2914 domain-containing protein [Gammaproteobacteria bacterium]